jgi:hypothetical protein
MVGDSYAWFAEIAQSDDRSGRRDQATADAYHTDFLNLPANNDANYFQSTLRALYMTLCLQKFLPTCGP